MAWEKWFIDCHIFNANRAAISVDFHDSVDQKHRISMRHDARNRTRIKHATESGVQLVRAKAAATQTGLKAGAVEAAAACVPTPHSPEVTHTELAAGEALHAQECPAPPAAVEAEAEAVHADISEQPVPEAHSSAEPACEGEAPPAVSEAAVADESAVPGPAAKEEEGPPEGGAM